MIVFLMEVLSPYLYAAIFFCFFHSVGTVQMFILDSEWVEQQF